MSVRGTMTSRTIVLEKSTTASKNASSASSRPASSSSGPSSTYSSPVSHASRTGSSAIRPAAATHPAAKSRATGANAVVSPEAHAAVASPTRSGFCTATALGNASPIENIATMPMAATARVTGNVSSSTITNAA